jgi:anti-sigma regulatory factor (Ser/Thr protein kinase)
MTGSTSPFEAMKRVLELRASAAALPRLVAFAETFAASCGLPPAEKARLMLILEELFTNTVRYGYPPGVRRGRIAVALAAGPGRIEIDFSDDGEPFDPLAQPEAGLDRPPAERPPGGLGLHILRALADEAHYRRVEGRNHLAVVRYLPHRG